MIEALLDLFPLIVAVGVATALALAVRLKGRTGRAPTSAGPLDVVRPNPPGLVPVPWELQAIQYQIDLLNDRRSMAVPRYDLTATVNRLMTVSGLMDPRDHLPVTASAFELEAAVTKIEDQLGLAPMSEGQHRQ